MFSLIKKMREKRDQKEYREGYYLAAGDLLSGSASVDEIRNDINNTWFDNQFAFAKGMADAANDFERQIISTGGDR